MLFAINLPEKNVKISSPRTPCITSTLLAMLKLRDQVLRKFQLTERNQDSNYYKSLRNYINRIVKCEL